MSTTDNPAGRLVQVITDMDNNSSNAGQPFRSVLSDTFDFPHDDGARVLTTLGNLFQMTLDGKKLVESLDRIDKKLYLEPFLTVKSALS